MAEVIVKPAEQAEDPKHVQNMVDKAEAGLNQNPQAAATDAKPEWLGDFEKPEDMAKAYQELRAKMSKDGAPKGEANAQGEGEAQGEQADPSQASRDEAAEAAENAGVDMAALEAEFQESGALSDATYENLAKAGFSKEVVDGYIAGQQAIADQLQSRIEQHAGGKDQLDAAIEWAKAGLPADEIEAFNNTVDTADEAGLKLAVSGLMAKYAASNGTEPNLMTGGVNGASGEVFRSTAEVTRAMSNPRYTTDPAYRQDVEAKLLRSSVF